MTREHPTEGDVKRDVKRILERRGWWHFMPPANTFGRTGISDILALREGVFLAVETKLKKAEATEPQKQFHGNVRANGGYALVVNKEMVDSGSFELALHSIERLSS